MRAGGAHPGTGLRITEAPTQLLVLGSQPLVLVENSTQFVSLVVGGHSWIVDEDAARGWERLTVGRLLEVVDCRQPRRRDLRAQAGTATLLPIGMRSLPGTTGVRDPWNHNLEYQHWLLDQVPVHCEHALDVGCGDGWLARRLAERGTWVTGIDLSAPMIDRARQAAVGLPNLTFEIGNLLDHPLPEEGFDFVSAVAVLHHLPFEPALARLAALLRPGGILAVIGLARDASIADLLVSAAAIPINRVLRARRGWWESGAPLTAPAMSYGEIRGVARQVLPGATVRRRLLFRYSLAWHKH